ncbi:MAG: c-type cytochrome, partial [Planctomycetes bacterium]|nr:c-type cytochrome [Planctomycetota bacterium]
EAILALQGDLERGRKLFFNTAGVQCINCHAIQKRGKNLGPDLSKIGKKYNRAQLLETILQPSKKIEPKYLSYLVETKRGRVLTGLLVSRSAQEIVLKDNKLKLIRIPAANVETIVPQRKSIMPELLLQEMTAEQVADLLTFLASLK